MVIRVSDYLNQVIISGRFFLPLFLFMKNTLTIGKNTESYVSEYLKKNGFCVIERNYRSNVGEIDIIASKNRTISFVEVKKIVSSWDVSDISYKVSISKQYKIKRTASSYLAHHSDIKYDLISFDVAAVQGNKVEYYKGAF